MKAFIIISTSCNDDKTFTSVLTIIFTLMYSRIHVFTVRSIFMSLFISLPISLVISFVTTLFFKFIMIMYAGAGWMG